MSASDALFIIAFTLLMAGIWTMVTAHPYTGPEWEDILPKRPPAPLNPSLPVYTQLPDGVFEFRYRDVADTMMAYGREHPAPKVWKPQSVYYMCHECGGWIAGRPMHNGPQPERTTDFCLRCGSKVGSRKVGSTTYGER